MSKLLDLLAAVVGNASTGDVTATNTPTQTDSSKKLATTEFVKYAGRLNRILVYRISGGVQQVSINGAAFTSTGGGTYTPDNGMKYIVAKLQGGGGAGGGTSATNAAQLSFGTGGGAGAYGEAIISAGLTPSVAITVGGGGVGVTNAIGTDGGASAIGALIVAGGGNGGVKYGPSGSALTAGWGNSATVTGSAVPTVVVPGAHGGDGFMTSITFGFAGSGARGFLGKGTTQLNNTGTGPAAVGYGDGGGGGMAQASGAAQSGGNGFSGLVIIEEYV